MTAQPLGFDLAASPSGPFFDHVEELDDFWVFCEGPVVEDSIKTMEIPKSISRDKLQAIECAQFVLVRMRWAHEAGIKKGQRQAQRHLQLALGLADPTKEEQALWNNSIPLKRCGDDQ